jgi:hypothetical protein
MAAMPVRVGGREQGGAATEDVIRGVSLGKSAGPGGSTMVFLLIKRAIR